VDAPSNTVLVVDDDASIRLLCRLNLQFDGMAVREAATIAQAREQLGGGGIDVVVLDVHVGSGSGVDFLTEIRREYPDLKVAMLTGSVGSPALDDVAADAFIPKPFTIEQLTDTVASLAPRVARKAG